MLDQDVAIQLCCLEMRYYEYSCNLKLCKYLCIYIGTIVIMKPHSKFNYGAKLVKRHKTHIVYFKQFRFIKFRMRLGR